MKETRRLGEVANVYVTLAATRTFADYLDPSLPWAEAQRTLTDWLCEAKFGREATDTHPEQWRFRRRSIGYDINANVIYVGNLAVVVAVSIRPMNVGRRES